VFFRVTSSVIKRVVNLQSLLFQEQRMGALD
jgi:hypothetical protein